MKPQQVKQAFGRLASRLAEIEARLDSGDSNARQHPQTLPTIRRGEIVRPEVVEACAKTRHEIAKIAEPTGVWGTSSVDDVVWFFVEHAIDLLREKRRPEIQSLIEDVVERLVAAPSSWVVDLLVYGLHESCADIRFGRVRFLRDDMDKLVQIDPIFLDFPLGTQMFARLEVAATDEQSAIERAGNVLDEHLLILNALCSWSAPSPIQVSRSNRMGRSYAAVRVGRSDDSMGPVRAACHNLKIPLMGVELERTLKHKVGARVSEMLASQVTEFNQRILLGYQFAGAGCVDSHPERSFLMFAIALESVILGRNTKSELTYQLGSRVAHLIGKGLSGRKLVADTVSDLYDRRSRIVHIGEYGVSRREAALMQFYCDAALGMLTVGPSFAGFKTNAELAAWFNDRMLDGPDHFEP